MQPIAEMGREQMKTVTMAQVHTKGVSVLGLYLLVHNDRTLSQQPYAEKHLFNICQASGYMILTQQNINTFIQNFQHYVHQSLISAFNTKPGLSL